MKIHVQERWRGLLLGTAVGDALGLPAEGLSRARRERMFPGEWRHRLLGGRGMVSDDTDHTVFVAQSLLASPQNAERFAARLGWCLRGWLLTVPAGIGFATLRACLRLWLGVSPTRSGVFSAGNGPAMRVAPIGAFFALDPDRCEAYLRASTCLTHTDPKALIGTRALAHLIAWVVREAPTERPDFATFLTLLHEAGDEPEWNTQVQALETAGRQQSSVEAFAAQLGLANGVTGYIYHTVPVVLYAWYLHFGDFRSTLQAVLNCGGDADTTGAIAGALAGVTVGESGIPADWIAGIQDWPRSTAFLRTLADHLANATEGSQPTAPVSYFWPALPIRNFVFLLVILLHGFRRLLPPY